ncbi:MAG: glycine cleavage system protein T, partial [Candidatus Omnitrophica bacterium]|nr:glycine cleavage system protein T [Candidatus Omnitrophota bacterium]
MELKNTPLTEYHRQAGAQMGPFGGWLMPIQYSGIISEHRWTRSSVSLFDISHMGEFFLKGD